MLASKFLSVGKIQGAAALGLQEHVREEEKHPGLGLVTFLGNLVQPALTNVPPPCERGHYKRRRSALVLELKVCRELLRRHDGLKI